MAKGFNKLLLAGSVIAGAAVGSYMYFKKEGVIDETKSPSENAVKIKNKVTADAAEYFTKDRNYVDLNESTNDTQSESSAADTFEPLQADKIDAADGKTIGSTTVSEEFFNDEN